VSNGHKIDQYFPPQDHPKFIQIGMFGLKNHLATTGFHWKHWKNGFFLDHRLQIPNFVCQ
jgi:hypothetical protein